MSLETFIRHRPTARVLVVDEMDQLLLFHIHDTSAIHENFPTMQMYWITPGGGGEPNETFEQAAWRELEEETGIKVDALGAWVWYHERVVLSSDGRLMLQERFYLARVPAPQVSVVNLLPYEQETHRGYRWWSAYEIEKSDEYFLPHGLGKLLPPLLAGNIPTQPLRLFS